MYSSSDELRRATSARGRRHGGDGEVGECAERLLARHGRIERGGLHNGEVFGAYAEGAVLGVAGIIAGDETGLQRRFEGGGARLDHVQSLVYMKEVADAVLGSMIVVETRLLQRRAPRVEHYASGARGKDKNCGGVDAAVQSTPG